MPGRMDRESFSVALLWIVAVFVVAICIALFLNAERAVFALWG